MAEATNHLNWGLIHEVAEKSRANSAKRSIHPAMAGVPSVPGAGLALVNTDRLAACLTVTLLDRQRSSERPARNHYYRESHGDRASKNLSGVIACHPLKPHVRTLPASCRVRVCDHFPLAKLVSEFVSDLELHGEETNGPGGSGAASQVLGLLALLLWAGFSHPESRAESSVVAPGSPWW